MEKEVIVKWKIREGKINEVLKLLPELAQQTRKEEGNLFYTIYQSEENPNELVLHERYADGQALHAHKFSEHYLKIVRNQILPLLETREVMLVQKIM